jgi:hypothetical protein
MAYSMTKRSRKKPAAPVVAAERAETRYPPHLAGEFAEFGRYLRSGTIDLVAEWDPLGDGYRQILRILEVLLEPGDRPLGQVIGVGWGWESHPR